MNIRRIVINVSIAMSICACTEFSITAPSNQHSAATSQPYATLSIDNTLPDGVPVDCNKLLQSNVISSNNPIGCNRLVSVSIKHHTFNSSPSKTGEIVVLDTLAPIVRSLFERLYQSKFPIESVEPILHFEGNDIASMEANNTSAFNGRAVTGGTRWSIHAYGAAIDINPIQNPYIKTDSKGAAQILPLKGSQYLNRSELRAEKSQRHGLVEATKHIFYNHGFFIWGGDWDNPIDFQHFQLGPRAFVEHIARLPKEQGRKLILHHIDNYRSCVESSDSDFSEHLLMCREKEISLMSQINN